ncbi:DUF2497 domain-containing protein [Rhizobium sp. SGZ-381]|uniref:DUF2497 domain-containing protein n=1 Tax=Rhizobium sp. SGZ-381 TaxID=3342800 RepID=UPI003670FB62
MAQPSVAREPSMEEILASIRRIIESNDPVGEGQALSRPQAAAPANTASFDEDEEGGELSDEMDTSFVPQRAANDPGLPFSQVYAEPAPLRPPLDAAARQRFAAESQSSVSGAASAASEQPVAAERPGERSLSLADVAARVRAAAGRVPEPIAQRPAPGQKTPDAAQSSDARFEADVRAPAERPVEVAPSSVAPLRVAAVESPAFDPAPVPRAEEPAPAPLPTRIEEAASLMLLSEEAGAQVARSFNELAEIFNGIERRSVEEMARELLQPMLREWLDDNLPALVERLVREEIERVARGPRR